MKQSTKPSDPVSDPLIGQTLGDKYTITRLIGRGGVGLVYHARQIEPARDVVVKVLSPHWERDAEAMARFDREAKRLAGLQHPNIVEMFDYGHDQGRSYLVMEHLDGELLSDHVARKKKLSLEEFVPIAAQILKGIGHAHLREMMVRDVKPANIMLCERKGRANFVKILDFGLAKLLRGEHPITEEHVMGTVGYLAPEAIKGEPLDLRVDVYAIGVLFYYMLAGKLPFDGETNAAVFYKTINDPAPDLHDVLGDDSGVPDGLIDLIHSCLEKDRARRPHDADRIVEQLIDVAPASMFRLPRSSTERHGVPITLAPGTGNSGLMELVNAERPGSAEIQLDGSMPTPPPGTVRPLASSPTRPHASITGPHGRVPDLSGDTVAVPTARTMGLVAISVITGALLAILVVGGVVLFMKDDGDKQPASASAQANERSGEVDPRVSAQLDEIDAKIAAGQLDVAATALDQVRGAAAQDAGLRARVERLDKKLAVERLVATAATLEAQGDIAGAITAYRDAVEADPAHAASRAALSRLSPKEADDKSVDAAAYGLVDITSRPLANLQVDGAPLGTTPFHGKLPVGRHDIRLSARGYNSWSGTFEVGKSGNLPLSVQMRGKGSGGSRDRSSSGPATPAPVDTPSTPPPTPPQ
ncbi:MAG TPA: protein kinase [Nannocystaceae bacterium]|nr:protein kinase [Nannocystaceae bacterium]